MTSRSRNDETRFSLGRNPLAGRGYQNAVGYRSNEDFRNANAELTMYADSLYNNLVLGKPRQSLHRTGHQWWQQQITDGPPWRWGRRILQPVLLPMQMHRTPGDSSSAGASPTSVARTAWITSDRSVRSTTTTCRCMTTTARSSTASVNRIDFFVTIDAAACFAAATNFVRPQHATGLCGRRHDAGRHPVRYAASSLQGIYLPATTSPPRISD